MFEFTVRVSGVDWSEDGFETSFLDAGLDDATISVFGGLVHIDVSRDATSFGAAVGSALDQLALIPLLRVIDIKVIAGAAPK